MPEELWMEVCDILQEEGIKTIPEKKKYQLYVELSVAAKSRFMMREAGLDLPLEDSQKATYLSQYEEYTILEKRLGKSARMAVAPVVKFYPADRKALEDLLAECRQA